MKNQGGTTLPTLKELDESARTTAVACAAGGLLHLLVIRPNNQLLAGHHRIRAAKARKMKHVWASVEPMDDDAAFMELATSNNQGELAPLEIGIHALKAVPKAQGKKNAGLTAYADLVGKSKQTISELRQAAEVAVTCPVDRTSLLDRAQHLAAIHSADRRVWPECVATMLKSEWTAKDTEHWVGKVRDICQTIDGIGPEWEDVFLGRVPVVERFLATKEFSARTVAALGAKAASISDSLSLAPEAAIMGKRRADTSVINAIQYGKLKLVAKLAEMMPREKGGRGKKTPLPTTGVSYQTAATYRKVGDNAGQIDEYWGKIREHNEKLAEMMPRAKVGRKKTRLPLGWPRQFDAAFRFAYTWVQERGPAEK